MKIVRISSFIVVLFAVFSVFTISTHAELYNRGTDILGNQLIYDSDLNVTWYDYAHSYTSDWDDDEWQIAMTWASDLTVNFGGIIYSNWRLPSTLNQDDSGPCNGYNCTESEMGHLFYSELENEGWYDTYGNQTSCYGSNCMINFGPFQNLQSNYYWTDMEIDEFVAWGFLLETGQQRSEIRFSDVSAIAVIDGDVAVVPEPISSILFVTGGTLLAGRRFVKRKKA